MFNVKHTNFLETGLSNMTFQIIAIDGPTGVGKSTLAQKLAIAKQLLYVDTGAMFRCLAWKWKINGLSEEEIDLVTLGETTRIEFSVAGRVFCEEEDVTEVIRSEEIATLASQISQFKMIRESMKYQQRLLVSQARESGEFSGSVLEGRDIGTVVLPFANVKFFLVANLEVRVKRRYDELKTKDQDITYEEVLQSLQERDERDQNRMLAPLQPAKGAIHIDTSSKTVEQILIEMLTILEQSPTSGFAKGSK